MTHLDWAVLYSNTRTCYTRLRSGWGSDGNVYNVLRGFSKTFFLPCEAVYQEPHERSAAARVRGRDATGRAFRDERSSSVNTHTAHARPWGSHGSHPEPVRQPAASGAQGPSSRSERTDGQVRDARRVLQEGRDEVCAGVAQHRSCHEPLSGDSQKPSCTT